MPTSVPRQIRFPTLITTLKASTWSSCQAIGCFLTKPAFPSAVRHSLAAQPATAFVSGCGKGRVSERQTHGCRGPADIPSIAR